MQPIIEVENLSKQYKQGDTNAVDGISFTVAPGEFFALLGPNGAGKTTTISILTTTLSPTAGNVRMAGYDIVKEASAVRKNIGIIFQHPSLDLNLSAEESVRFHAILYGLYPYRPTYALMPGDYKQQVDELAAVLGLEEDMFKPVKTFSGGMKRKLEIVRSLIHQPKVLFLDEPTTGLDAEARRSLWDYLEEVRAQNDTTIFLTTHYLEEAERADSICIINRGKIVSYGTPDQIKADLIDEYLLIDASDRDQLRAELANLAIPFSETPLFKIDLNGKEDGPSTHQLIKSINTPLSLVRTHAPSLEDAYLKIVRNS